MATSQASGSHVVLVGMMGAGKSSVGKLLAERLDRPFLDVDAWIEDEEGMSIAELFRARGEAAFRDLEASVLPSFLANPSASVLSLGGGAVMNARVRMLLARACVVWLRADHDTLVARVGDASTRPLLSDRNVDEELARLSEERAPVYAAVADVVVDVDGLSLDDVVDRVAAGVR